MIDENSLAYKDGYFSHREYPGETNPYSKFTQSASYYNWENGWFRYYDVKRGEKPPEWANEQ